LACDNPDDFSAGIDRAIYSALDYSFIVQCPDGCYCPPGLFPQTISILASTIPPVLPPTMEPGFQIVLRLQGCISTITRTLAAGATQADINAAAQSMQAEWAGQQAQCIAQNTPGVNCVIGSGFLNVCNDAQTINCPGFGPLFIPAGQYCEKLNITGLTPTAIAAAVALIKARLNELALEQFCPAIKTFCSIIETIQPTGGAQILIQGHNVSSIKNFDSSTIQYCDINGNPIFNSVFANTPPLGVLPWINFSGPGGPNPFIIKYQGAVVFTDANFSVGHDRFVDMFVNCG